MNLFVIPSWYPSGQEPIAGTFIAEQAQALAAERPGLKVVVCRWGHGDAHLALHRPLGVLGKFRWRLGARRGISQSEDVWHSFVPSLTWSGALPFGGISCLIRAGRKSLDLAQRHLGRMDIIHAHVSYPAGCVARALAAELKIPYVLTEHMSPFPFPKLMKNGRPIEGLIEAFRSAAKAIAVSDSLADRIASFGIARPVVIPNLVNEEEFVPSTRRRSGKFVLLCVAAIIEQKGIGELLRAMALWDPRPEEVEVRIAGDGPMRPHYQRLARDLRVEDRVRWLGSISRKEMPAAFQSCDAFVLPSRRESFGVVLAEALATGIPVISTRSGGPDSIVNERNGVLVEIGDVPALAEALEWMKGNRDRFDPVEIRGDFEARFSRAVVVDRLMHLYEEVLGRHHVWN